MKIGSIAVDGHSGFPNLALMRLSVWHKAQGDEVEWWDGLAEAHKIVTALRDMDVAPFAQLYRDYDGGQPTEDQLAFARWVDQKMVFQSCSWEEYKQRKEIFR